MHHLSPEMTLKYAEIDDNLRRKKYNDFINIRGEVAPLFDDETFEEKAYIKWLKKSINAQMLPNGICGKPLKLGNCEHANACLTCNYFRTSQEFLEIHKQQLKQTEELISIAESNHWEHQVHSNKIILNNLSQIIKSLEVS